MSNSPKIYVVGYPSDLGGAGTELWHVLRIWRQHCVDVRLIPTWKSSDRWRLQCAAIGIPTIELEGPQDLGKISDLPGAIVVSFCNGEFLKHAHCFRELGCKIVWVNCMTWLFDAEREHYASHGPFDAYVFQSEFQRERLLPQLTRFDVHEDRCFTIRGALDVNEFCFSPQEHLPNTEFVVGRLARPDLDKWHENLWAIYGANRYPQLRARVMGWSDRLAIKLGEPPDWAQALPPGAKSSQAFLKSLHCMMPINGGAAENWPRVGLEAMALGVPIVAENRWGWREMLVHGETGFLAEGPEEFAHYGRLLATDEKLRRTVICQAREDLVRRLASVSSIMKGWQEAFDYVSTGVRRQTPRIIIGALSAAPYVDRRQRCMETWGKLVARYPNVDLLFIIGDPARSRPHRDGDILYLPCPDDYDSLPQKTRSWCQWALDQAPFDYLFKCDDDTYISVDRLVSYRLRDSYIGCDIGGYASGGAGYFLSKTAAWIVAERLTEPNGTEDLLVGRILTEAGLPLVADSRFGAWPRSDQVPRSDNHMITGHGWRDGEMLQIHFALGSAGTPALPSPRLCRMVQSIVGYGEVGLNGNRGFVVDDSCAVDLPKDGTDWSDYETLSAHAPSSLHITTDQELCVFAVCDGASWEIPGRPIQVFIDGRKLGDLLRPHDRTIERQLSPGQHVLRTTVDGPITRRYPIWVMRRNSGSAAQIVAATHHDMSSLQR